MKFKTKAPLKKQITNVKPLTPEAEQRILDSVSKQMEAMLMRNGFMKEEISLVFASKGDPHMMAMAIANAQIAREDRKTGTEVQEDVF
ncbi:MAG: hypothetical protein WBK26_02495 [Burkholderiaceae bacterium]